MASRIKLASFPLIKEWMDFDFVLAPTVSKPKVLELARCQWIDQHHTAALIGIAELEKRIFRSRLAWQLVGQASM